ncbi:putative Zinc finger, SWIM-type, MULE transposase domain-containing protein [Helianthus debilis subsp. tardiflorus]
MKGPYPGQILTAVGVDANNGIYPVAYAVVESENTNSWLWFLGYLGDDLDIHANSNFTFISDRLEGLIPAINRLFPVAEHRYCLRHIHENMKSQWRGDLCKDMLWKCASATTVPFFNKYMDEIKEKDVGLYNWLQQIPPNHWTKSHFSGRAKCDVLLNNLCECFNKQLVRGRDKPIISCLEYIREYMMRRIGVVSMMLDKCDGPLTPGTTITSNQIKKDASQLNVVYAGQNKYEVSGEGHNQCVVDVNTKSCTCRKWELTGMPCKHAVAINWDMVRYGIEVDIPEAWVDEVYWLDNWKKVYQFTIDPIKGREMWEPTNCPTTLLPPKYHNQVGRPKKARKKSAEKIYEKKQKTAEVISQSIEKQWKLTRKGGSVT